jgi:four helix bundle protein
MRDHRSLEAWQEANAVTKGVIRLSMVYWKAYGGAIFSQLQRASLSVQLNIAEGYSYGNSPSFTRFLGVAYGSAVETVELLELAVESDLIPDDEISPLLTHARSARNLLLGLLRNRRKFK